MLVSFRRPLHLCQCMLIKNNGLPKFTYTKFLSNATPYINRFHNKAVDKSTNRFHNQKQSWRFYIYNTYISRNNIQRRLLSTSYRKGSEGRTSFLLYLTSAAVLVGGLSYAAVPLYRIYCQATGYGGTTKRVEDDGDKIENLKRLEDRKLKIRFEAGTNKKLQWKFKPQQKEVKLTPGETALAFYTAENLTDRPIIGIATYNVIPFDAGQYFNKIQCFCFEEQQLNPHEEVDMPVFFYIDPDFDEDPKMGKVDEIILSYTFFESSDGSAPMAVPH